MSHPPAHPGDYGDTPRSAALTHPQPHPTARATSEPDRLLSGRGLRGGERGPECPRVASPTHVGPRQAVQDGELGTRRASAGLLSDFGSAVEGRHALGGGARSSRTDVSPATASPLSARNTRYLDVARFKNSRNGPTAWEIRHSRHCERCGGEIAWRKRLDARTCSDACRQALHRNGSQNPRFVRIARRVGEGRGEDLRRAPVRPPHGSGAAR